MRGLLTAILTGALAASAAPPKYDRMYVFGDSYFDTGAGYVDGNGPTAVAYLAEWMGLKLVPANDPKLSKKSSRNYAVSGAQTGDGKGRKIGDSLLGYGMRNQVEDFTAGVRKGAIAFRPATTLFFLAGGLNDRRLPGETTVSNLKGEIRTLYGLGGRHFRIAQLPVTIPEFSDVGLRLNPELERIPAALAQELPGADIQLSHWGKFFDDVRANPAAYGIENIAKACAGRALMKEDATPCPKPETYFYYHAGHPSTAVHKAVGAMLHRELTEP